MSWFGDSSRLFGDLLKPSSFYDLLVRPVQLEKSGVCGVRHHVLCQSKAQGGGPCRCRCHYAKADGA